MTEDIIINCVGILTFLCIIYTCWIAMLKATLLVGAIALCLNYGATPLTPGMIIFWWIVWTVMFQAGAKNMLVFVGGFFVGYKIGNR